MQDFFFLEGRGGGGAGGCFCSAAIFNNLDATHNLNAWNRLQTNINFITLYTLLYFTINIKQKVSMVYHFIYKMILRLFRVIIKYHFLLFLNFRYTFYCMTVVFSYNE